MSDADPRKTKEAPRVDAGHAGLSLVVQVGGAVRVQPLPDAGTVDVGRDAECALVLDDESISRRHARIRCGGGVTVEDLGSTNGTRVNGAVLRAGERRAITPGNVLEIGSVVAFVRRGAVEEPVASVAPARASDDGGRPRVVADPRMRELYELLDVVAPSPFCVLVLGETGVGKDVFAEALHHKSTRARGPFMRLNCAALAESILESELFGHEKGAFTGAVAAKQGLFEAADGGTVFLDEVGDMPATTQAKLLRVLENGEVMRLGSTRVKKVDVRFVSATNRDLQSLCDAGLFRSDLYFRLSGVVVTIPPLRERLRDVEALARHFVSEAARRLGKSDIAIRDDAMARLMAYPWPGNIRELRNVVERAALVCRGDAIEAAHIDAMASAAGPRSAPASDARIEPRSASSTDGVAPTAPPAGAVALDTSGSFRDQVKQLERARILDALEKAAGNQSRAAKLLGMPRRTFVKRLDAYGIARPRKGQDDDEG